MAQEQVFIRVLLFSRVCVCIPMRRTYMLHLPEVQTVEAWEPALAEIAEQCVVFHGVNVTRLIDSCFVHTSAVASVIFESGIYHRPTEAYTSTFIKRVCIED